MNRLHKKMETKVFCDVIQVGNDELILALDEKNVLGRASFHPFFGLLVILAKRYR